MRARELMTTDVVTLPSDATLAEAVEIVIEHELRHLPVIDADGILVGVLSDRDLRHVDGLLAQEIGDTQGARNVLEAPALTLVSGPPVSIGADDHVDDVIDRFLAERLGALVVVDADRRVLGIVSVLDLLAAAKGKLG